MTGAFANRRWISTFVLALAAFCGTTLLHSTAQAQFPFGPAFRGVVGGVQVDADGVVKTATIQERSGLLRDLRNQVLNAEGKMAEQSDLRMISLSKLQKEIARAKAANEPLTDEVRYLAGLQRIEYVFVYPEKNDIVLAGPAEGWKVRDDASVVGIKSGRPVLQLEDLLTAMRTVQAARREPISVSIDPTPEGEVRLRQLLSQFGAGVDPTKFEGAIREAFGPQMVTLTTVANTSRMAQTLVAADYRMKCMAMKLEPSPADMPSYMDMIRDNAGGGTQPRWWMTCDYDAVLKSEDGLAWKLTGQGVKALTEEEHVATDGSRTSSNRKNKLAQKWADEFTQHFDKLCSVNAAFGDLRNVMDMNVITTLIVAQKLDQTAGLDLSLLAGDEINTPAWNSPKAIPPHCSFVRGRAGWTISASGGVEINPWRVISQQTREDKSVALVHKQADSSSDNWWW